MMIFYQSQQPRCSITALLVISLWWDQMVWRKNFSHFNPWRWNKASKHLTFTRKKHTNQRIRHAGSTQWRPYGTRRRPKGKYRSEIIKTTIQRKITTTTTTTVTSSVWRSLLAGPEQQEKGWDVRMGSAARSNVDVCWTALMTLSCWLVAFRNCISSLSFFSSSCCFSCSRFSTASHFALCSSSCFFRSSRSLSRSAI